jgi:hypothetical protein
MAPGRQPAPGPGRGAAVVGAEERPGLAETAARLGAAAPPARRGSAPRGCGCLAAAHREERGALVVLDQVGHVERCGFADAQA